jgi:hypothetical protein
MNTKLYAGILSLLGIVSICSADAVVDFADTNLQRGVERALGLQGPTQSQMLALTRLEVDNKGIADLTGLEYALNLTSLKLVGNRISNLRPLAGLTKLTTLDLKENQVEDITDLRGLVNLTELILWRNEISDISPLSNLTALTDLQLNNNQIADTSSLWPLTKLTNLMLGANQITDISAVSRMKNLLALILHENKIRDLSPLSGLANLRVLNLDLCGITDISALAGITSLVDVHLSNNPISDISPLLGLRNLRDLNLDGAVLNGDAYCAYLRAIQQNNLIATIVYSPNSRTPEGARASDGTVDGKVAVTWEPVCSGPAYTTYYRVYRALSESGEKTAVSGWQTKTSFEDTTAAPETVYVYWVKAAGDNQGTGETDFSRPDSGWCAGRRRTLTVGSTAGGTVVTPGIGPLAVNYGQSISLAAEAGEYYIFAGWTGTAVDAGKVANPAGASATITIDGDYTIRANFTALLKVLHVENAAVSDPCENGTWRHPFDGIQEAIDVAADETAVVVGPGIFRERIDFLGKDILLIGAGAADVNDAGSTILDGSDAGPVVTFRGGETARCMLMDLVVTGGNGVNGGGILCKASSSPTIRRCAIVDNFAMRGAGMYLDAADPVLIDCRITGNTAVGGAGLYCRQADLQVIDSAISNNFAVRGGAMYCDHARPVLIAVRVENNAAGCGGGLYCDQSAAYLSGCVLRGNTPSLFQVGGGTPPEIVNSPLDAADPAGSSTYCQTIDEFWADVMAAENPDETAVMRFLISLWGLVGGSDPIF